MIYKNKNKNLYLEIKQDLDYESPRNWDNLGIFVDFLKDYHIGDKHFDSVEEFLEDLFNIEIYNKQDLDKAMVRFGDEYYFYKVRAYIHSGITISISEHYPYNDYWDSSFAGFIYIKKDNKEIKGMNEEEVLKVLESEIKVLDQFLIGDVYTYRLFKKETCKCCGNVMEKDIDCCGGFYGDDYYISGMLDNIGITLKEWKKDWVQLEE